MNTAFYIAKRYLFSKKSLNAIHIISGISMVGILVGSAALIIILSVFNGFEDTILSMYNKINPDMRIEPAKGKFFNPNNAAFTQIKQDPRVLNYTEVVQEKVLLRYGKSQYIASIKGVSDGFLTNNSLDSTLIEGEFKLVQNGEPRAIIGSAVQTYLAVNIGDHFQPIEIYSPAKGKTNSLNPADEFSMNTIFPGGVFQPQEEVDNQILVPITFARNLLGENESVSAIEIRLKPESNAADFQEDLKQKLGADFLVKNRIQQNELLYKILNSEKWAIFLILTFVLIIAIFNIIGSLSMLVIDKKKDIAILSSMGASKRLIRRIFFTEGMLIALIGCLAGLVLGAAFCVFQQKTGWIKMDEGSSLLISAYPVSLKWTDFIWVVLTVISISAIASAISSSLSVKSLNRLKEDL